MFTQEELVEALPQHHGIRKGLWSLSVNLRMVPQNFLAEGMEAAGPSCAVIVEKIGIQRVHATVPGISVDASKVRARSALRTIE